MYRILMGAVCALVLMSCNDGRRHGANIPIDPVQDCDEQCGDLVCDLQGVEECFEECTICEVCEVCPTPEPPICFERIATEVCESVCVRERYGNCCEWADACETTVDFVLVPCPDEPLVCPEPLSCDDYPDDTPRGHLPKECRGHGPLVK